MKLQEYVQAHTTRGNCECGKCLVSSGTQEKPSGHTVSVTFFTVGMKGEPHLDEFIRLVMEELPFFFGITQHDYIQLGAWLGDQGLALQFMALGHLLGAWRLISPDTEYPERSQEERMNMAGLGGVLIVQNERSAAALGVSSNG